MSAAVPGFDLLFKVVTEMTMQLPANAEHDISLPIDFFHQQMSSELIN